MKLSFFADQCVPGSVIRALHEEGHEILRLKDWIAVDSPDPIALQVRNHPKAIPQLISRLVAFISSHPDRQYFTGKLVLVEPHRVRIRS
jgi:hypothetical protein